MVRRCMYLGGSSPHTRGALVCHDMPLGPVRIIPAYAGSTSRKSPERSSRRDHPRIRGEHSYPAWTSRLEGGSSPHTRGARVSATPPGSSARIIPAYAGSTDPRLRARISEPDHPRIRGEHFQLGGGVVVACGSSPHTRGAHAFDESPDDFLGIIPAYAGSTRHWQLRRHAGTDHPRIRGEHILPRPARSPGSGSSPHTRGAPYRGFELPRTRRIIPAYAGSTPFQDVSLLVSQDHPRIRGEHEALEAGPDCAVGSAPHTR